MQDVVFRDHAYTGMQKLMRPSFYRMEYLALKQRMGAPVKGNSIFQRGVPYLRNPAITEISMFDFVPWDRQIIKDTITTQLGWEKPPEKASSLANRLHAGTPGLLLLREIDRMYEALCGLLQYDSPWTNDT